MSNCPERKSIWVHRPDLSGYLDQGYIKAEESILRAAGVTRYTFGPQAASEQSPAIVITSSNTRTEELAKSGLLKETKVIIHPNSGYDNFSLDFIKQFKGKIILGNSLRARAVADYILQGVLSYAHFSTMPDNSPYQGPFPKTATWDQKRSYPRQLLETKPALIIGQGHIGKLVKHSLESLGMKVSVYDPFLMEKTPLPPLREQKIICLCASLNPTSQNLVNQEFLNHLPDNFLLINAARGALVDLTALVNSLKKRPRAFALVDVFCDEPFPFEQYGELHNLHCTSHIAGVYDQLPANMLAFIEDIVRRFILDPTKASCYALLKDRLRENFLI